MIFVGTSFTIPAKNVNVPTLFRPDLLRALLHSFICFWSIFIYLIQIWQTSVMKEPYCIQVSIQKLIGKNIQCGPWDLSKQELESILYETITEYFLNGISSINQILTCLQLCALSTNHACQACSQVLWAGVICFLFVMNLWVLLEYWRENLAAFFTAFLNLTVIKYECYCKYQLHIAFSSSQSELVKNSFLSYWYYCLHTDLVLP